jgi:hypothetical protein
MLVWGATNDVGSRLYFANLEIAIPLTACAGLLVSRCARSAQSRVARLLDRHLPDAVGFEETVALIVVVYLPAVLLTLLLRLLGIRGQRTHHLAFGKGTRIARRAGNPTKPPT